MTTANLLSLRGLGIRFGGLVAVDDVDFNLPPSHVTCIIGPNGAGKSTLFNLITGIYKPSGGQVILNGEEITGLPAHVIAAKGIARTFQSSRLFEDLSILDNVMIGMHSRTKTSVLSALLTPRRAKSERRPHGRRLRPPRRRRRRPDHPRRVRRPHGPACSACSESRPRRTHGRPGRAPRRSWPGRDR